MNEFGFIEEYEGLIGDGDYMPEVLFLMREPNSKNATYFWFKKDVVQRRYGTSADKKQKPVGARYFNTLSALAKKMLQTEDEFVLQRCAYMNLYPYRGESRQSQEYKDTLSAFRNVENKVEGMNFGDMSKEQDTSIVAVHRAHVIQNAIDKGVKNILTTPDIFDAIINIQNKKIEECQQYILKYNWKGEPRDYRFHICYLGENNQTRLISFWHPSCTLINKDYLAEINI